jgi:hypothetical protein
MVARDSETQRAVAVPPLRPETAEEREAFERGERNKQERLAAAAADLTRSPPSPDERLIMCALSSLPPSLLVPLAVAC